MTTMPPYVSRLPLGRLVASVGLTIMLAGAAPALAQLPPFVELRVPKPPTVATAEKGSVLVYELHVTNLEPRPLTLRKLDVISATGDQRVVQSLVDTALTRALARPGLPSLAGVDRLKLAPGTRAVAFLWVPVDGRTPPTRLQHRVTLEAGTGDSVSTRELDGAVIPVMNDAITIGPPLRGGPWLTANGPDNFSGHRRALIPIAGVPAVAQRFAIDYVLLGTDDKTFTGDEKNNASYHAEGKEALAVANGTVVAVKDGIPENIPGVNSRAVPITLETVGGNHVIIDIGSGHYAFYAHLEPGSLRVKLGDQVKRGQVIGLVGNTGNSTEPHLHFHISDGNSPLGSEGLPYRYDAFEVVGHCSTFNMGCQRSAPVARKGEIPLANTLVHFP